MMRRGGIILMLLHLVQYSSSIEENTQHQEIYPELVISTDTSEPHAADTDVKSLSIANENDIREPSPDVVYLNSETQVIDSANPEAEPNVDTGSVQPALLLDTQKAATDSGAPSPTTTDAGNGDAPPLLGGSNSEGEGAKPIAEPLSDQTGADEKVDQPLLQIVDTSHPAADHAGTTPVPSPVESPASAMNDQARSDPTVIQVSTASKDGAPDDRATTQPGGEAAIDGGETTVEGLEVNAEAEEPTKQSDKPVTTPEEQGEGATPEASVTDDGDEPIQETTLPDDQHSMAPTDANMDEAATTTEEPTDAPVTTIIAKDETKEPFAVETIQCFQCVSKYDEDCEDGNVLLEKGRYKCDCASAECRPRTLPVDQKPVGCRKITQLIVNEDITETRLVRQCAYSGESGDFDYRGRNGIKEWVNQCSDESGCNAAHISAQLSFALLSLSFVMGLIIHMNL